MEGKLRKMGKETQVEHQISKICNNTNNSVELIISHTWSPVWNHPPA
jgi:hypothetical protein